MAVIARGGAHTANGGSASYAPTMPTHVAGDTLMAVVGATGAINTPSGWVTVDQLTGDRAMAVFTKTAASSSEASRAW